MPLVGGEYGWSLVDSILSSRRLFPKLWIVRSISTPHPPYDGHIDTLEIQRRAKEQTHAALQDTKKVVEVLDVGIDREIEVRVNDLISTMHMSPLPFPSAQGIKKRTLEH